MSSVIPESYILESKAEAYEVLVRLWECIHREGFVTRSDLLELLGLPTVYNDSRWGWSDLYKASVVERNQGFELSLPKLEEHRI